MKVKDYQTLLRTSRPVRDDADEALRPEHPSTFNWQTMTPLPAPTDSEIEEVRQ